MAIPQCSERITLEHGHGRRHGGTGSREPRCGDHYGLETGGRIGGDLGLEGLRGRDTDNEYGGAEQLGGSANRRIG